MILHIDEDNFEDEVIYSEIPVVVDFWARWCRPCLTFAPTFKELSKKYEGKIKFLKCDIEKNKAIANLLNVKSIPTLLFFCSGEVKERITGKYNVEKLEERLKSLMKECQE